MKPAILTFLFGEWGENDEVMSTHLNAKQKLKWHSLALAKEDVKTLR